MDKKNKPDTKVFKLKVSVLVVNISTSVATKDFTFFKLTYSLLLLIFLAD